MYARRRVPPTQTLIISSAMSNCQLKLQMMTKRANFKKKIQFEKIYSILHRSGFWENCRAAYEDVVKHLER